MRDMPLSRRPIAALVAVVLAAAACSGTDTATTTTTAPPTTTTAAPTTTAASAPLDPLTIETLGVSITLPRDWILRQDGIVYGHAAAIIDTEEGPGGVFFIGLASEDLDFATDGTTAEIADANADLFSEFFFPTPGTSEVTVAEERTVGGVTSRLAERVVAHDDGTTSVSRFLLIDAEDGALYAVFLYQGDLNEQRIAEGEAILESIVFE